jgi:hypothetical protein
MRLPQLGQVDVDLVRSPSIPHNSDAAIRWTLM